MQLSNPTFMSGPDEEPVAIRGMLPTELREFVDIHGANVACKEVRRHVMD